MHETLIQDKYLLEFLTRSSDGLQFREIKANTVSPDLIATNDLLEFLSTTELNKVGWKQLLRKYSGDEKKLLEEVIEVLQAKIMDSTNMAIFLNSNKSFTFDGVKLHLFYPSGSEVVGDKLFDQNIFSVAQEYPYKFSFGGQQLFSFRPDLTFFVNGFYIGYSEFKSTYNNQNASKQGRGKVIADYLDAVQQYDKIAGSNDVSLSIRKSFLRIFEKAIFITATDMSDTYVIRGIEGLNGEIRRLIKEGKYDFEEYKNKALGIFKSYPASSKKLDRVGRFNEVFQALYSKKMLEKEILYYNFIENDMVTVDGKREFKNEKGKLISPRPKQKFGTDKIIAKIDEFLEHEHDDDYFLNKLKDQLAGVGEDKRNELIAKRQKYQNNKNVYSLLLQYAAGFGKSNIIGWSTLQLKDLKRDGKYVYDKVMIVVDRLQLRDQITAKMYNMNVNNKMFIEANNKKNFIEALSSDTRIVIVNLQKFGSVKEILDSEVVKKLSNLRIAFLIDEIHRSQSGDQHEDMVSLFDELQASFDKAEEYKVIKKKKNLIVGFTATPSDHTLARFGEFNHITEGDKIWVPFDSYTMKEAIEDGYILNPLKGIVPVSAKMYFENPENALEGFEGDTGYEELEGDIDTGIDIEGKKYAIRKTKIYSDPERIKAISEWIAERLVNVVYGQIRGTGKAMLAVSSKQNAIKYKENIDRIYNEVVQLPKYKRFEKAPVYIVYSDDQENTTSSNLNNGVVEKKVIEEFGLCKNGLMIVVDKLQTGFDEPKLHTLFLDKEIQGINAIQTISRVNRTCKDKNDCKIIDFSYKNVNIKNIKKAFEHFSNIVVSDFDPLGDEKLLGEIYVDLVKSNPFLKYFSYFKANLADKLKVNESLEVQSGIINFINNNELEAKSLKKKIGSYFRILNLIENVITVEGKFCDKVFLEFWHRFNIEYRNINKTGEIVDDVEIYFDNKIGFVDVINLDEESELKKKKAKVLDSSAITKKYRYDILSIIAKRNEEESELESKIVDFENKIDLLFDFVDNHSNGKKLQVKMKSLSSTISDDEVCGDFEKIYNEFVRKYRSTLGEFFIKQSKELVAQLCSDYKIRLN